MRWIGIALLSSFCFFSAAFAQTCGPVPNLDLPKEIKESVTGNLDGQANFLRKFVGTGELSAKAEAARSTLFADSDKALAERKDAYLYYVFCSIIATDASLLPKDKLRALQDFRASFGGGPRRSSSNTIIIKDARYQSRWHPADVGCGKYNYMKTTCENNTSCQYMCDNAHSECGDPRKGDPKECVTRYYCSWTPQDIVPIVHQENENNPHSLSCPQ